MANKPSEGTTLESAFIPLTEDEIEELQPAVIKLLREAGSSYPCHDESEFLNQVDALFTMAAASLSLPSPCGHPSQYAYTEDGGAHMVCLLCERKPQSERMAVDVTEHIERPRGNWDPNETTEERNARLDKIKEFVDSVNTPSVQSAAGATSAPKQIIDPPGIAVEAFRRKHGRLPTRPGDHLSLADRLELAAQACRAAHLLSCEATCRDAIEALRSQSASTAISPEQFADVLKRIVSSMNGHTISRHSLPAFTTFMVLLESTTPYACGIGPMPRDGNTTKNPPDSERVDK